MGKMEENTINKCADGNKAQAEAAYYDDEINLMDYFIVLLRYKRFICLSVVLPVLTAAVILFLLPQNYTVTYIYDVRNGAEDEAGGNASDWSLNEMSYDVLVSLFYSEENINKLSDKLRKEGHEKYAVQLTNNTQSREFVKFEAIPTFSDVSKLKTIDPDQLKKIRNIQASLLHITITGKTIEDMHQVSSVIRNNFENMTPLYSIQEQSSISIREYNNILADIDRNRFSLGLALKNNNKILAGLKMIDTGSLNTKSEGIVMQFDIGEQNQYLPLTYQIQAAESKAIRQKEDIITNEEKYSYYNDLLDINSRIFAELDSKRTVDYTLAQFKSFLTGLMNTCEKSPLKDYLNSYIRKIENRIEASKPVTEKPEVSPVAKGTIKKIGFVFLITLTLSTFAVFLKQGLEKNRNQTS
jgi:hypothetical protein